MNIIENILNIAKERGLNDQNLCKILKTHTSKIYDWKNGRSKPTAEDIYILATYFDLPADYILGSDDETETALLKEIKKLSEEQKEELLNYLKNKGKF